MHCKIVACLYFMGRELNLTNSNILHHSYWVKQTFGGYKSYDFFFLVFCGTQQVSFIFLMRFVLDFNLNLR